MRLSEKLQKLFREFGKTFRKNWQWNKHVIQFWRDLDQCLDPKTLTRIFIILLISDIGGVGTWRQKSALFKWSCPFLSLTNHQSAVWPRRYSEQPLSFFLLPQRQCCWDYCCCLSECLGQSSLAYWSTSLIYCLEGAQDSIVEIKKYSVFFLLQYYFNIYQFALDFIQFDPWLLQKLIYTTYEISTINLHQVLRGN